MQSVLQSHIAFNDELPDTADDPSAGQLAALVREARANLAGAPPDKAWQVALDTVKAEQWPHHAGVLMKAMLEERITSSRVQLLLSMVQVLSELQQCIQAHYTDPEALPWEVRRASLSTIPAQLQQPGGLLESLQYIFVEAWLQRYRGKQPSSCMLGHGPDCPAVLAAAAAATPIPAHVAKLAGAGPPCRSCLFAHAELLVACSALLRFWPDCVLEHAEPAWSWVAKAAECALAMLQESSTAVLQHQAQDVSTAVLQHQAQDVSTAVLQDLQQQSYAAGMGNNQQPDAPSADVLQPGLAAIEMLAAVCAAAAYPRLGDLMRMEEQGQPCERGMLDHPCMLPSMLAVGAAAVLGQEMQRRLCRTAAAATAARAGSAGAVAASRSSPEQATCGGGVVRNACGEAAACGSGMRSSGSLNGSSMQGQSEGVSQPFPGPTLSVAAWQLVCMTEQWAGGQLLPEPFALLVEALGCSPKAFLLLACIWQQQQQAGSCSQAAGSARHTASDVLAELSKAYHNVFPKESSHTLWEASEDHLDSLVQRLKACDKKGQQQPQQTQQHLQLALLLMREAVRGAHRGMFQPGTVLRKAWGPSSPVVQLGCGSFAAQCASTWLNWAQFRRDRQCEEEASGAPVQQRGSWDVGGEASSAVLIELLQGHCLLLHEAARELQAVSSSWVAAGRSSISSTTNPDRELTAGGAVSEVDRCVRDLLKKVLGMLHCLTAAVAVDSTVLQQAAPHLFGLAGTLERLVRTRTTCHCDKLLMEVDAHVPLLLQLLFGSLDLSACAELDRTHGAGDQAATTAAARAGIHACGLLPFLATSAPLGGRQQRQLLGLLFSALKMFSAYPTGLYAFSWSGGLQEHWLVAAGATVRAACMVGRLLLVSGGDQGGDGAPDKGTSTCSQATGGSSNGTAQPEQQHHQQTSAAPQAATCSTVGLGSNPHSCGLGAEGMAALLPWVVLQGRALQLWVALFRVYVQLPPQGAAGGSKAGARSTRVQEGQPKEPFSLAGSSLALKVLSAGFQFTVMPSVHLLAYVLQSPGPHSCIMFAERGLDNVPGCRPDSEWLQQQLTGRAFQLFVHRHQQGGDLTPLRAAGGSAATAAALVKQILIASGDSIEKMRDNADVQHKLRQSDVRRYLKTWQVTDAAVLKGVTAMLANGEHSAAGVAVAAWLCSPNIAGNFLDSLQDLSTHLSTLPIHEACNNPACRVTKGSREQGLVCGKACVCGGCKMGHYCSRACQREHWPVHQLQCGAAAGVGKQ